MSDLESRPSLATPKRGVKKGTNRGRYKKISDSAKQRIVNSYKAQKNWKETAQANGIKVTTARAIINRADAELRKEAVFDTANWVLNKSSISSIFSVTIPK